jgi:aspartyl-tRNA(Asn)/glutamyl-tRNA(Gln) amidotransferase subunit A
MSRDELASMTIGRLAEMMRKREVSPVEVTDAVLTRIAKLEARLKAYITVTEMEARNAAKAAEHAILAGHYLGPLHGIPAAVKDIMFTKGIRTTAASKILATFVPDHDAAVVERLKRAGAVIVGKANTHEFALGVVTPPTRNPWDTDRIPGGSSGGSGAAVAASLCIAALGSDTGGSIRIPAACCGIVGLKPTYGRVSRYGVLPLSWSLDHVGPMTKTVEDAALLLSVIAGPDPRDAATLDRPVPDYARALTGEVRGVRLGLPKEHFFELLDPEVEAAVREAIRVLERLGARLEEVSIPHLKYQAAINTTIALSEAACYHEHYLRTRADDYNPDVRLLLEMGTFMLAADYVKAQRLRTLLRRDYDEALKRVDVIVHPSLPVPATKVGQTTVQIGDTTETVLSAMVRLNRPGNQTGLPVISVPCGFTAAGLPIGLGITGKPWAEATVLRVAHAYEQHTAWLERRPPV